MYATKMKTEPAKMLKNLWGDRFYFAKEKKWKGEKGPGGKVTLLLKPSHDRLYLSNLIVVNYGAQNLKAFLPLFTSFAVMN